MTPNWDVFVTCEHASNLVPPEFGSLGLEREIFQSHVAWDEGARELAEALAERGPFPVRFGEWTRLLCDLNRSPENPDAVPPVAFGVAVPGNQHLCGADIQARLDRFHAPYWRWVIEQIERGLGAGRSVLQVSFHSFTPVYAGVTREVDVGLLIDPGEPGVLALSEALTERFRKAGLDARINEPYDGRSDALTTAMRKRFGDPRYFGVSLEMSHKFVGSQRFIDTVVGAFLEVDLRRFT